MAGADLFEPSRVVVYDGIGTPGTSPRFIGKVNIPVAVAVILPDGVGVPLAVNRHPGSPVIDVQITHRADRPLPGEIQARPGWRKAEKQNHGGTKKAYHLDRNIHQPLGHGVPPERFFTFQSSDSLKAVTIIFRDYIILTDGNNQKHPIAQGKVVRYLIFLFSYSILLDN